MKSKRIGLDLIDFLHLDRSLIACRHVLRDRSMILWTYISPWGIRLETCEERLAPDCILGLIMLMYAF
jgi:hypothetical protein